MLLASCTQAPTSEPTQPTPVARGTPKPRVVRVDYRVDVRISDGEGFAESLSLTMSDPRGWIRAGFVVREDPNARHRVVIAEGDVVDKLCKPYGTDGKFSCQNGPMVAINADRWRKGVEHWPGDLASYRRMLLNHEMGHLLGQHHRDCPGPGRVAPVMQQQSGSLDGCQANSWPLPVEIARAARHDLKIAPAFGE